MSESILQTMGSGTGFLKAGFLGFQKSGKSYTAMLLALGVRRFLDLKGPLVMYDTEGGSEYLAPRIKKETGVDLIGVRSRSLADLLAAGREAERIGASVMLADSMTHPWREVCDAHLKKVNEGLAKRGYSPRTRLEFQDWNPIKSKWSEWTDFYLNSKLHIIICGRAGFEYDYQENEDTGKKDLVKTGVKMKTEGEFGFEPSLLVEMERVQRMRKGDEPHALVHQATVIGDRFSVIDGQVCDNPAFEFFLPHVALLRPGSYAPINTEVKTDTGVDADGNDSFAKEKRERVILCEEIQGALLAAYPGQTAKEKKAKTDIIEQVFRTRSWTKVETFDSAVLRKGLEQIRIGLAANPAPGNGEPTTGEEANL